MPVALLLACFDVPYYQGTLGLLFKLSAWPVPYQTSVFYARFSKLMTRTQLTVAAKGPGL